jgi:muconolactone delta-isomerase
MSKDLPSIDDFAEDNSNLPSINDYLTEENAEELPSVEDFIEKEEEILTESTQTIEDADGNSFAEVKDIVPPWPELVKMVNDIRADIPDIPEIKYYDKELEELAEQISNLPEVRYYDREVEAICDQVDLVREQIKGLPEVKYYDEQVDAIEDRIDNLQTEVANLPEVKYYDSEIEAICEAIDAVKASIPKFPSWVNEVNEVPDFSWIGKTFSVIDDDFVKVNDTIEGLRGKVQFDLEQLSEDVETKHFNSTIKIDSDIKDLDDKLNVRIKEEKDKIWKELRDSSMKIWEYHKEFKDDDRKLKKQILGEYNKLKQSIKDELKEVSQESVKTDELLLKYFTELREEITNLPEIKYYDKDIDYVKSDIKGLYKIVEDIKSFQKKLQEEQQLLAETNVPLGEDPPETNNPDPLTPLNQNFVTLDQLQKHYKIFVERVQYQLASIGGGGAGFIRDLDDVTFDESTGTNKLLIYNGTKWVGIASTSLSGSTALVDLTDVDTSNLGDGRFLRYDASSSEFTFAPVSATNLELIAGDIQSGILTTTSTDAATVMSISASTYRSAQFQIQAVEGSNYNMTTINIIHDGSDTYMTEYGTINQPVGIATFASDISGGSLRLLGYPASTNSTTFKVVFTALEV